MTHDEVVYGLYGNPAWACDMKILNRMVTDYENNLLQSFAQWLWDNRYLTDEAFTVRLVEQYREQMQGKAKMKVHNLKIRWDYLIDVLENGKNFEIRKNDRDFNKGDIVKFIPVDIFGNIMVNSNIEIPTFRITYVFYGGEYGIDKEYCVFGIDQLKGGAENER